MLILTEISNWLGHCGMSEQQEQQEQEKNSPGMLKVLFSVLAAMIGIQSDKNRERDFETGHIGNYIFVGIIVVAIFIFSLISIVNGILEDAAK